MEGEGEVTARSVSRTPSRTLDRNPPVALNPPLDLNPPLARNPPLDLDVDPDLALASKKGGAPVITN